MNYLKGYIRELSIFNKTLSTTEVSNLSNGTSIPGDISGLRAWYKIDEESGTDLDDSSGNNLDATISGATWSTLTTCP